MQKKSFTTKEHLKKNSEIKKVFDKGAPFKRKLVNIYLLKREKSLAANRVAFLLRRALCNKSAVKRNRFRRILREAYRKTKYILLPGHDIILFAKNVTLKTKSTAIEQELKNVFKEYIKK